MLTENTIPDTRTTHALVMAHAKAIRYYNDTKRCERALRLCVSGCVNYAAQLVQSEGGSGFYHAGITYCNCPDSMRGNACKHRIAISMMACAKRLMSKPWRRVELVAT